MLTKVAIEDIGVFKRTKSSWKINEAQAILDANILKWESTFEKNCKYCSNTVPIQVAAISRTDNTTVIR